MNDTSPARQSELKDGSTVAVIGGGPAGAFFAIHMVGKAEAVGRTLKVIICERRRSVGPYLAGCGAGDWKGCNYCAGGISPKLHDVLEELGLKLPEEIIQSRIRSISIQGFWKNIELEVPLGREMVSVYRGSRPHTRFEAYKNFDSFLLDEALKAGSALISD